MAITEQDLRTKIESAKSQGVSREDAVRLMKNTKQVSMVDEVYGPVVDEFDEPVQVEEFTITEEPPAKIPRRAANEMATYGMLAANRDFTDLHTQQAMVDEMERVGSSRNLEQFIQVLQKREDDVVRGAVDLTLRDPSISMDEKPGLVRDLVASKRTVDKGDFQREATIAAVDGEPVRNEKEAQVKAKRKSKLDQSFQSDKELTNYLGQEAFKFSNAVRLETPGITGLAKFVGTAVSDIAGRYAPLYAGAQTSSAWYGVHKELYGEGPGVTDIVDTGAVLAKIRDDFYSKQGESRLNFAKKIVSAIKNNAGIMGYNSLVAEHLFEELTSRVIGDPELGNPLRKADFSALEAFKYGIAGPAIAATQAFSERDVDASRWLETIGTVLDYADAGWVIRTGTKGVKTALHGTPAGTLADKAPNTASEALAVALEDPKIAEALGTTPQEIYEQILPAVGGVPLKAMPDEIVDNVKTVREKIAETLSQVHYGINYADEEKKLAVEALQESLDGLTGGGYRQSLSSMKINKDGTGVDAEAVIGLNRNYGYPSVAELDEGVKRAFGEDVQYTLQWKNPDTGLVENVPEGALLDEGVEFFAKVNHQYRFDMGIMQADKLLFGDATVSTGAFRNKFTNDANARLSRFTNGVIIRAYSLNKKISGDFHKVLSDSFGKLGYDSKIRVMHKVEEGSEKQKVFLPNELVGFSAREMEAYYTIRSIQDATWVMDDARMISSLRSEGMKQIRFDESGYVNYAKPYDKATAKWQVRRAFDPVTNTIRPLSDDEIERLYTEGASIARLKEAERVGDTSSKYVIVTPSKGMKVWELPQQGVLSYIPGYMTRVHKENWYIDAIRQVDEDGVAKMHTTTVANTSSRKDAQKVVDELNAKSDGKVRYDFRMNSSFKTAEEVDNLHWDVERAEGRLKTGHRGDRLKNVSTGKVGKINDMVDSLVTSIAVTAKRVSHSDAVASLKARAMNSYGHVFPRDEKGQRYWPSDAKSIRSDYEGDAADVAQAQAFWEHVNLLEKANTASADFWRNTMVDWANKIEGFSDALTEADRGMLAKGIGYVAKPVGKTLLWSRNHDPLSALNGLAFNVLILTKPIRQALMGSTQHNFYYGLEPKYFVTGKAYKEYGALQAGLMAIDRPELWKTVAPRAAKIMGMSVDEYKTFVKGFKDSGLIETITSHSFAREGLVSMSHIMRGADMEGTVYGPLAKAAGKTGMVLEKVGKYPILAAQKVGFTFGEYNNKSMSYLLARKRYLEANPKADLSNKAVQAQIASQAEDLAFNMTPVGSFAYQRGWLKNATQFMSFQHKALLQLLPESVGGSKMLAAEEKARIAAVQVAMWGMRGIGGVALYKHFSDRTGVEFTPEMQQVIEDGLGDYALNEVSQAIFEDEGEVAYGALMAPAGGSTKAINDFIYNGLHLNIPEFFLGASYSAVGRIRDIAHAVAFTTQVKGLEDEEKFKIAMMQGATIVGQYNDYIKAQAALHMGAFVNRKGEPVVDAQFSEIFMKGLVGAYSKKEIDYQHYMESVYPKLSAEEKTKAHEEAAQMYYERLNDIYIKFAEELPENPDEVYYKRLEAAVDMENTMLDLLPPEDLFAVKTAFRNLLTRNVRAGTDKLVDSMAKAFRRGEYGSERDYFMNVIRRNKAFTEEQKAALEDAYDYSVESTKEYIRLEKGE